MTTTNRIKAGTAYGCAFVNSGCNWPEGGCSGNCTVQTRRVEPQVTPAEPDELPVQMLGDEPTDWASFRPLVAAVLVICMALLVGWRLL